MRFRSLALALLAAAAALSVFCPKSGAASTDPSALVTAFGGQLGQVLGDGNLSAPERRQRLHRLLDQGVDFPRISCFVLGRYWQGSSDSFRQEFSRVFEEYLIQSLTDRFTRYSGDWVDVTGTREEGEHSTVVLSVMMLPSGTAAERIDWRMRNTPSGYKIEDVSDSGVSMAVSYRDQFAAVISHDGGQMAALIPDMRRKLDEQGDYSASGATKVNAGYARVNECTP